MRNSNIDNATHLSYKKPIAIAVITLMIMGMIVPAVLAELSTDKPDYAPTDTVYLTGSEFLPNHIVDLTLSGPESFTTYSWSVTSDENGSFQTTYTGGLIEGLFTLTATDGTTTQTTTFTDVVYRYCTATISPVSASAGQTKTYTVTITNDLSTSINQAIQTASVSIPSDFTDFAILTSPSQPVVSNTLKSWTASIVSGVIQLASVLGTDKLDRGESVAVSFTAKAPSPATDTDYQWTTAAFQGDTGFELIGSQPKVTVTAPTNTPPTAAFTWSPTTPDEGQSVQFTDQSTDSDGTVVAWSWSFDDTGTSTDQNPTHTFADNGVYTVSLTVTDDDGASSTAVTHDVTVNNVAPTVDAIAILPSAVVQVNTAITAGASFTDPGTLDTHTASWDWDYANPDTTTSTGIVTEADGDGSVAGSHTYTAAGVYTVVLTVTDKDGGVGTSAFEYVVVYDPGAGFVTGGGWIDSPAGAYLAEPSLTGKATFGFVSKYLKGANVPTGNTEFQFHAADMNFKSTSYEWLVVTGGNKALYKGVGTINGAGNYGFMLSAIDGGAKGADLFRIQIWNIDDGSTVYDNMIGQEALANPATTISGSIVVHK